MAVCVQVLAGPIVDASISRADALAGSCETLEDALVADNDLGTPDQRMLQERIQLPDGACLNCWRTPETNATCNAEDVPLVLLHGTSLDNNMWKHQMPALLKTQRALILLEFRGHGASDVPTTDHYNHLDIAHVLQLLGVEQCVLIGLSLGGKVAIDVALQHPRLVKGLVLMSPGLSGYRTTVIGQLVPQVQQLASHSLNDAIRAWHDSELFFPSNADPSLSKMLLQAFARYSWVHIAGKVRMREPEGHEPAKEQLYNIACKALILNGEHDLTEFKEIGDFLQRNIQSARQLILPGAGHMLNMERPDLVNALLREFIDKL